MPRRQKHGVDNPKRRGEAPPFWSLGVQGRSRNAPAVLLGDKKGGILSRERMPPLPVQRHRRCPPPPMAGKRKSPTTFVVMLYGAGDEARSRHCRAATRTAGDKRPTGAFSRFARALFDPLPAGTKKPALLRRTSVLRSKTLAEGEFTSPEHFNFLPESKKEVTTYVVTSFLERATRLARGVITPRHAQRAPNAPLGRFLASLMPCSPLCPLEPKNKGMTYVMPLFFGAGDEARTRYLHLGKVALYQMSYARGTRCTIPDIFRFVKHRF